MKKRIIALLMAVGMVTATSSINVYAMVNTESKVSQEMCSHTYWTNLLGESANTPLMTDSGILNYNLAALKTPECNMNDIESMDAAFDASALSETLAADVIAQAPQKDTYVNGIKADVSAYYSSVSNSVMSTAWQGTTYPKYALAVEQTQIKAIPTVDYIGYSETDSDDEIILSSLRVNEPFLVKQCAIVNGAVFYFGYSTNVSGWVLGDDLAFCDTKTEWTDMWKAPVGADDFLLITCDEFTLSESHYAPATSNLKLTMGTTLRLVPAKDIPRTIGMRGSWNNYIVYIPTRDSNGRMLKQISLVSQGKNVHEGYLTLTSGNIIKLAYTYLGNTYGWGGMLDSVDCSAYLRNIYKCFGLEMPRNTNWQREVPGTAIDLASMDDTTKTATISALIPGTPLFLPGHTMIYLGTVNGTCYVISAMGSASDSVGPLDVTVQNSVVITSLDVRRRNGNTWLTSITTAVQPWLINN